ncbi:sodium/proline symporter [Thalassotalea sp. LPB0316]|uniref:sodium/proline symporter n=1 Tax=Thalassotalea sp. LPB0316 TaxID=2769490 RepID=UPI001866FAE5|nr:sodium/proline symporter [Thalassotalea sp. LPB0316]QOL26766.1 sodium/proline symporter [Thalassotalea sp. LPB0316]
MEYHHAVLITLIVYKLVLIGIGLWSNQRNHSTQDYFIGSHSLGPWVAAVSSAASASSAWSLLGMSGAAYIMGVSAAWIPPGIICGYIFNWFWLAPRLQKLTQEKKSVTLTELLAEDTGKYKRSITLLCSLAIIFAFSFYIAAQFQAAGKTFASTFDMSMTASIVLGTVIILIYTLLGGFWAVSITDTLQGLLMAATSFLLPIFALWAIGGPVELWQQMQTTFAGEQLNAFSTHSGMLALGFVLGLMGIGLGNCGQPHVVNRLMAIKSQQAIKQGRIIAISWATIVYGGMVIVGWSAKVLIEPVADQEQAFFVLTAELFSPIIAGIIIAAVLSAIMSTADSQLLVSASALSYDVAQLQSHRKGLIYSRLTVVLMCLISTLIALFAPEDIFTRVLFAWNALGAAFGPLLVVRVCSQRVDGLYAFMAIFTGFFTTIALSFIPSAPGDYLERLVPFFLAFFIAWLGRTQPQTQTS